LLFLNEEVSGTTGDQGHFTFQVQFAGTRIDVMTDIIVIPAAVAE
jgi:hypothetical protein